MSDKLWLNCWILGHHPARVFPVGISSSKTVGIFKKKIKKEVHPELDDYPTLLLDLWKDDLDLDTFDLGIIDEGYLKGLEVNGGIHGEHGLKGWEKLSEVFTDSLNDKHLHIIVHRSNLKRNRQPPRDITQALLSRWSNLTMTLPTSQRDLMAYFNKPLEENEKVPLSHYCMTTLLSRGEPTIMCSEDDLRRIFRVSEDEEADYLWTILKTAIVAGAPDGDGTDASFISFWDDNIRKILNATFAPNKIVRDNNRDTSTNRQRPNFGFLKHGVCIFRGEEKPPHYSGNHPKDELFQKLIWTYHPAPWILGYYAVGAEMTLATISCSAVVDISMLDLSYRTQRIDNILRMIKLPALLDLLQKMIGPRNYPEFVPIIRDTGTIVVLGSSHITKTYNVDGPSRISHLLVIYDLLCQKAVPNVDSLLNFYTDHPHYGSVAYLQPRGVNRAPTSYQEVQQAVLCILEALVVLHGGAKPLFHRDIRWPNVILSFQDPTKWFLIDWDDASTSPTRAATNLDSSSHSPAVFVDNHGAEVDIWGVGMLIVDACAFVPGISETMVNIGTEMVKGLIGTASQAQARIRQPAA